MKSNWRRSESKCKSIYMVTVHALANARCFLKKNPSITAPKCTESTFCVHREALLLVTREQ